MIPENIKIIARKLRSNQTKAEEILWNEINNDKLWFRVLRQKIFYVYTENNLQERYIIPDFYIAKKKLIIEIDWSIHKLSEVLNLDKIKDELIEQKWFDILRITNEEIYSDLKNVINTIKHKLKK